MTRLIEALEESSYQRLSALEIAYDQGYEPDLADFVCDCDEPECEHEHDDCDCPHVCGRHETHVCEGCYEVAPGEVMAKIGRSLWIHAECADKLFREGEWLVKDFQPERRQLATVGLWLPTEAA